METRFYNDLSLQGSLIMAKNETEFPLNPAIGTMIIKDQCLYAYIVIGGMETWYPFSTRTNSFIYTQGVPSSSWTIVHNLGSTDVWYQVRDSNDALVIVGSTIIDANTIRLDFTQAIAGTAVVVAPDSINVPQIKATEIHVASDAVIIDSSGVRINGSYALTSANIATQISDAVAVETTARIDADATVRSDLTALINAEATARQTTDSQQSTLLSNETAARVAADTTIRNDLNAETTSRNAADAVLQAAIDAETTSRTAADATLTANLSTETSARIAADALKEDKANKGVANGYASLDGSGKVPSIQLPSYVDDIVEYTNLAAFPGTGETGKIYVALDSNKIYRWSGSAYIEVSSGGVSSINGQSGAVTLNASDVGIYIGTNVQPYSADLASIANINDMQTGVLEKISNDSYTTRSVSDFVLKTDPMVVLPETMVDSLKIGNASIDSMPGISISTTAPTVVDYFQTMIGQSAKYLIQVSQGSDYQVSELLVVCNNSTAFKTEYAVLETNGSLATASVNYNSGLGQVELILTMASSAFATVSLVRTILPKF